MVYKKQTSVEVEENIKDDFTSLLRRTLLYIWLSHFAQSLSVLFILLVSFHFSLLLSLTACSIHSIVKSFSVCFAILVFCSFAHRGKVWSICSRDPALIILSALVQNSMNNWILFRIYFLFSSSYGNFL